MQSRVRAGNLTAALLVVSLLELLVNRLANRLFLPRSVSMGGRHGFSLARVVADSGPFLYHLTGVLALLVLLGAMVGLIRRGELFPRAVRFTVVLIGAIFWLLTGLAVFAGQIPPRFALPIETGYGFLALLVAASVLGAPIERRLKAGVGILILPALLRIVALTAERTGWFHDDGGLPLLLAKLADGALLTCGLGAPLFWPGLPWRQRRWGAPLAIAFVATAAFVWLLIARFDLLQATVLYGLRIEIGGIGSLFGLTSCLALLAWVVAVVQTFAEPGAMRLVGYGLLLVAVAGPQAGSPVELAVSLVGLLAVGVGALRAGRPAPLPATAQSPGDWRAYVGRVAGAASDPAGPDGAPPEAVVVEEDDLEVSRIRGHRRGRPVWIRFLRRRGRVIEYEAVVGEPGRASPDATIERHRSWLARSPEQRLPLPRMRTGDASFDQKFSVHGRVPLADEALRRRFVAQGSGVLSLWAGAAARYRALGDGATDGVIDAPLAGRWNGDEPVTAVVADLDRLADLIDATTTTAAAT
ncbi:MAG TPA: hypothetical protein VH374_19580 [Polyangia bacterium]|jgi:hypothetical protein|nr:hypothetical protein [Polyangia bacterium]